MTEEQIKEYLAKYNLTSKELLATHIEQLKRNTKPNLGLISELVWVLSDFNSFFAENKNIVFVKDNSGFDYLKRCKSLSQDLENYSVNKMINDINLRNAKSLSTHIDEVIKGHSTRLKVNNPMTFLDELIELPEKEKAVINQWNSNDTYRPIVKSESGEELVFDKDCSLIGEKKNKGKAKISLLFTQFPKALEAITKCSEYGHLKYKDTDEDYLNYQRVNGGSEIYADASLRHRLERGNDFESGLPHQYHVAWNALAELELWIKENN